MSSRGSAVIEVAAGLPDVLACPWVAEHAVEFEPTGRWDPTCPSSSPQGTRPT